MRGAPLSSLISVDSLTGNIRAVKSFDFEQLKSFAFNVTARDGGSPPLSSEVTITINIQDENDNAPQVLYPVQTGASVVAEIVPRAADVGYLVTKVVAVDVDSGQNAWLSYKLQKATDRALFEVGLQNGEIRTVRQVTDKDAVKQKLTVVVEDNGQPSRSAVVSINVAVADSFPEVLSEFTDFTHEKYDENLTFYLVLALAAVSFLFITCVVVIISVKVYRWRQSRFLYQSNLPVIPYYPPHYADTGVTGTLPHGYNYEVCMTTDSRKSDCKFSTLAGQNVLVVDPSFAETMQRAIKEKNFDPEFPEMDNGQPSRSAVVSMNVAVADSFPEVLSEFTDFTHEKQFDENLTFYLVLALAAVSFLFITCVVVIISVKIYRWRQSRFLYQSNLPVIPYYPPHYADTGVTGTLPHGYNYEVCMTTDSRKSDCKFSTLGGQNVLVVDPSFTETMQRAMNEKNFLEDSESPEMNGEIRTARQVTDKDAVKQKLTVVVEDNGQPSRSAVVSINVAVADSFPEVLSEFTNFPHEKQYDNNLTFYLVLALAAVSFLFITCVVVIISVKVYRWRQSRFLYQSNLPVIPYYPPNYADTGVTGTLPHGYNYEVCMTTDSRKSDCKFSTLGGQNVLMVDPSFTETIQRAIKENKFLEDIGECPEMNGEIRTVRQVTDKDAVKQKLTVVVEDNGQPSRSAVVSINVAVADSFPEVLSEFTDFTHEKQYDDNLTFYLVLALAAVSFLFITCVVVIISVKIYRWRQSRVLYQSNLPVIPYYPPHYADTGVTGTLPHGYNYEVCMTTDSRKSDCKFSTLGGQNFLVVDPSFTETMQRAMNEKKLLEDREVPEMNGEIRTVRQVTDKDAVKQKLTVVVEDNGQPSRSAVVSINVAVADSFPEVLSEFTDFTHEKQYDDNLTFYLVLALAAVSFLFITCVVVIISVKIYRWRQSRFLYQSNLPVIPYYPPHYADTGITGTLPHRALFEVGLQNGEIRTVRQVTDKDAVKQKLTVVVEDNGQPSRSAVVSINVAVADSFPEVLSEFTDFTHEKQYDQNLTFYLVLALAAVSFLFITCVVVIISVKIYRWRRSRFLYQSNLPVIPYYPPHYADTGVTGTLPHGYNYEVCMTTDSRKSDCKFSTLGGQNVLVVDPSFAETMSHTIKKISSVDDLESTESNGEIRTVRQVTDKDVVKQKLTVVVEDNGQPSRSAVVSINIAVADSFPEVLSELTDYTHEKQYDENLTFYLVLALAAVSFLFITCVVVIISVKIYRWRQSRFLYQSNLPVIPYYPPHYTDTGVTGTLPHGYNYEVCMTTDSRKSDCKFSTLGGQNVLVVDPSFAETMSHTIKKISSIDDLESAESNGEIRTVRQVTDKDAVKQKLTVVVEDNGQPSRSAVVSINIAVADSFPEVLSEFTDFTHEKQYDDNLTFYLVLALAAVSFLFITCVVVIISVKIYRWRQSRFLYQSNLPVIPYYPPHYADTGVTGTLPHGYNYEVCMTTDSRKSDCKFSTLGGQNVLVVDPSFAETIQRTIKKNSSIDDLGSADSKSHYEAYVLENNTPGLSIFTVKASDADWNQNARVSYILEDSTVNGVSVSSYVSVHPDSGLITAVRSFDYEQLKVFHFRNGEIRTVRQVTDKDAVKQKLTVVVEDNGQPSRSAVVSINVAVADSFPEVLSEFTDFTHEKQYDDNLTFYLVLALAAVSFLFITCVVVIISVKIYRWRQSRFLYQSNLPVIPYYPPHYADTGVTGTLPHGYNYEVCMTTDSRKSDCKFSTLGGQNVLVVDPSFTETMQRAIKENNGLESEYSTSNVTELTFVATPDLDYFQHHILDSAIVYSCQFN
ncbi:protocadherin beta-16-like protein [Labeo rohita]|uniref:Protocadherin beta-16-like protein n=1 Tax=Labeo rohita TaxID=84645 RepID=A0A498P489_LABRO|nr:protocadherin beta-16-like protein [Labeo rohita]